MTGDLVAFLRARLDEDQRIAEAARDISDVAKQGGYAMVMAAGDARLVGHFGRARVLADVAAKRAIVDEHGNVNDGSCDTCVDGQWGYPTHGGSTPQNWPCRTLRLLAAPYADHPDYREEWKP